MSNQADSADICLDLQLYSLITLQFLEQNQYLLPHINKLGLVVDPVIKAIAGLVVTVPSPGSILHHLGDAGWSWGLCGSHKDPLSD